MSGLPEGVSRGPWRCYKNIDDLWEITNNDDQCFALFKRQDDAEYVIEIINHEAN